MYRSESGLSAELVGVTLSLAPCDGCQRNTLLYRAIWVTFDDDNVDHFRAHDGCGRDYRRKSSQYREGAVTSGGGGGPGEFARLRASGSPYTSDGRLTL
jgi:hypothetical protein